MPDPEAGSAPCVHKRKRGAPVVVYIYYAFDNRPVWFRWLWRLRDLVRRSLSRAPFRVKSIAAELFAALVYWPLARAAHLAERLGRTVEDWPLAAYRSRSFYTMRTDALDRFGTRLEHRMSRVEIAAAMARARLGDIRFSESVPFWCAVGRRL